MSSCNKLRLFDAGALINLFITTVAIIFVPDVVVLFCFLLCFQRVHLFLFVFVSLSLLFLVSCYHHHSSHVLFDHLSQDSTTNIFSKRQRRCHMSSSYRLLVYYVSLSFENRCLRRKFALFCTVQLKTTFFLNPFVWFDQVCPGIFTCVST